MRDLRDPTSLGANLLSHASAARAAYGDMPLSEVWDVHVRHLAHARYVSPSHPHEKYGDPRKIPSTMPNAVG